MEPEIKYTVDGKIGILCINRPQARNALNWEAQVQFSQVVEQVSEDSELRCLIIIGEGDKAFVAGGDIKELIQFTEKSDGKRLTQIMGPALAQLTHLPIPVIGAVNGDAIGGGCEILTACDLRIASSNVRFRFAEIHVALTTGWGGTARLIRLIGQSRAADLLLNGRVFTVEEALSIGFLHRVGSDDLPLLESARNWALELQALPKKALADIKSLIWQSSQMSLEDAYQLENRYFIDLWADHDHREALAAFTERRKAIFH